MLRRQGIQASSIKKKTNQRERHISEKELTLFTRQLATMLTSGVPLLRAFGIVARSQRNPALSRLILRLCADVQDGASLTQAFARHPRHFDTLYCSLIAAGEQAGLLDTLLDSLARHKEKTLALKRQLHAALVYPAAIVAVAVAVTAIILIWVVPTFKEVFRSVGAELPLPTLIVIALSNFMAAYWWAAASMVAAGAILLQQAWRRSGAWRVRLDRLLLTLPVLGNILSKAALARWSRTLATICAAGVPLIDALQTVGGAAGNAVYADATATIRQDIIAGVSLTAAIERQRRFPAMVAQMLAVGEASGTLVHMLAKVADFHEIEVDEAVASLSKLLEPFIMVVLGVVIGGLVIAMYLPIFKLGSVI